jgi:hypothetical protein
MIAALDDSSPMVLSVAADALAGTCDRDAAEPLLEHLRVAVLKHDGIPARAAKTALVNVGVETDDLLRAFAADDDAMVKIAILEVLREQCRKRQVVADDSAVHSVIVSCVHSSEPEIRSRAVQLLPYIGKAAEEIVAGALRDEDCFVRLHAVRACAVSQEQDGLRSAIHDAHWRVRQAAVMTLAQSGSQAIERLKTILLNTSDQFASEQIMEQLQLTGVLTSAVAELGETDCELSYELCRKAVTLGMDSPVVSALHPETPEAVLLRLVQALKGSTHPEYRGQLERLAEHASGTLRARIAEELSSMSGEATQADAVGAA